MSGTTSSASATTAPAMQLLPAEEVQLIPTENATIIRHRGQQVAMTNTAKAITATASGVGCFAVNLAEKGAAIAYAGVVALPAIPVIDASTGVAQTAIRNASFKAIDSDHSFGSEDSCLSRTTRWVTGNTQQ